MESLDDIDSMLSPSRLNVNQIHLLYERKIDLDMDKDDFDWNNLLEKVNELASEETSKLNEYQLVFIFEMLDYADQGALSPSVRYLTKSWRIERQLAAKDPTQFKTLKKPVPLNEFQHGIMRSEFFSSKDINWTRFLEMMNRCAKDEKLNEELLVFYYYLFSQRSFIIEKLRERLEIFEYALELRPRKLAENEKKNEKALLFNVCSFSRMPTYKDEGYANLQERAYRFIQKWRPGKAAKVFVPDPQPLSMQPGRLNFYQYGIIRSGLHLCRTIMDIDTLIDMINRCAFEEKFKLNIYQVALHVEPFAYILRLLPHFCKLIDQWWIKHSSDDASIPWNSARLNKEDYSHLEELGRSIKYSGNRPKWTDKFLDMGSGKTIKLNPLSMMQIESFLPYIPEIDQWWEKNTSIN